VRGGSLYRGDWGGLLGFLCVTFGVRGGVWGAGHLNVGGNGGLYTGAEYC